MSNPDGRRTIRDHFSTGEFSELTAAAEISNATEASSACAITTPSELSTFDDILAHAGEAVYQWDVRQDKLTWGRDADKVLQLPPDLSIANHSDLLRHIGRNSAVERIEAIKTALDANGDHPSSYSVAYRFHPDPWDHDNLIWIEERGFALNDEPDGSLITRGVLRVVTDHKQELDSLKFWATRDEVTCQLNRPQLIREIDDALTSARQKQTTSVFLLAAIENLAFINETYGYQVGDEVLAVIGQRFAVTLRTDDCIGRHSANKFGILLRDCGPEVMQHVAHRLLGIVREAPIKVAGATLTITLAIGGVLIPDQADEVQKILSSAHEALQFARTGHQNKFATFSPNPKKEASRAHSKLMADEIIAALNDNRMVLALQPIVASQTYQPAFYECLVRMKRENGDLVSAHEIIPVAEKLGLTGYLDHRVLEMAVGILKKDPEINLSINVSGQTTSDHDWLIALHKITQGRRDICQRMIIEITETSAIRELDETVNFVDALQDLGCRVAIDDFGSGYTSFQNLRFFGVDMVKIDGSFVSNITSDPHNLLFVQTLIDLAKKFGIDTVVEWVVDQEVADIMRKSGADYLQGSQFGMPSLTILPTQSFLGENI